MMTRTRTPLCDTASNMSGSRGTRWLTPSLALIDIPLMFAFFSSVPGEGGFTGGFLMYAKHCNRLNPLVFDIVAFVRALVHQRQTVTRSSTA
ncbi:hypothetical protein BKA93DRAFT_792134 [Sparassis latifolia]